MAGDVSCYATKTCTVRFLLRLWKVTKTFESKVTTTNGFAVVRDHHVNCCTKPLYLEGFLLVFRMNVARFEYGVVQEFAIAIFFFFDLLNDAEKILKGFRHAWSRDVRTKYVLYGIRPSSCPKVAGCSAQVGTKLGLSRSHPGLSKTWWDQWMPCPLKC